MNYFDQIVIYRNKNKNPIIHRTHNVHMHFSTLLGLLYGEPYIIRFHNTFLKHENLKNINKSTKIT